MRACMSLRCEHVVCTEVGVLLYQNIVHVLEVVEMSFVN